jgi:hypothetical protein
VPRHDVHYDLRGSAARDRRDRALTTRSWRGSPRRRRGRAGLRGRRDLDEARRSRASLWRRPPQPSEHPETLARFPRAARRSPRDARPGGGEGDPARAEGRRRRP